jgi:hypothetical protein
MRREISEVEKMRRSVKIAIASVVVLSIIGMPLGITAVHDYNVDESIRRGDIIVLKLHAFYATNGRYPNDLSDLVPAYIESIPEPRVSRRFDYGLYDAGRSFTLSFDPDFLGGGRLYDSNRAVWLPYLR